MLTASQIPIEALQPLNQIIYFRPSPQSQEEVAGPGLPTVDGEGKLASSPPLPYRAAQQVRCLQPLFSQSNAHRAIMCQALSGLNTLLLLASSAS